MSKSIVCPFCNSVISIDDNCKKIECQGCEKNLNFWDWNPCVWTAPINIQNARTNDVQLHGKWLCADEFVLNPDNANAIDIEIDSVEKICTVSPALVHKFNSSWFLTVNGDYNIYLNGKLVPKHAELNPLDSISILGVEMHLSSDGKIKAGKADFGVKNIELKNISAPLGSKTLSIDDITISAGEFVGILGPSGCGKSSLLEIMVGLRRNVCGKYLINGEAAVSGFEKINFAYVPQDIALHNELTLSEEISCFKQINVKTPVTLDTVERLFRKFGLDAEVNNATGNLSGGQRRRAGIMMELLNDPAILFMDEPTAGLDPKFESIVMSDLKALSQQGRIVICSTHIMENINLFDKVIFMNKNAQLEFFGSPAELLKKYNVSKTIDLYDTEPSDRLSIPAETHEKIPDRSGFKSWGVTKPEFCGYLKRMFLEIKKINFKMMLKSPLAILTAPLGILFIQPILIGLVLNFSCAYHFFNPGKELGFFFCIAAFWLGMNNAIRQLVKERVPGRCLERLRRVKIGSYLLAKLTWVSLLCTIQVSVLYVTLYLGRVTTGAHKTLEGSTDIFAFDIALILLLVGITGSFIGLAISAFNEKENAAICYLPMIIIPVLFFSRTIMTKFDDINSNKCAIAVAKVMPCYGAEILIDKRTAENQSIRNSSFEDIIAGVAKADWIWAFVQLCSYILVCLIIISFFQNKREKEWGGR